MPTLERKPDDCIRSGAAIPKSVRVLIVDDNPDMRAFIRKALERAGFETEVAANGELALHLQREHPIDVLITDIFMPELDGLELIQQFKSRFPRTKIIAMSGGGRIARADYLRVATHLGVDAVLRKPFATEILVRKLQDLAAR